MAHFVDIDATCCLLSLYNYLVCDISITKNENNNVKIIVCLNVLLTRCYLYFNQWEHFIFIKNKNVDLFLSALIWSSHMISTLNIVTVYFPVLHHFLFVIVWFFSLVVCTHTNTCNVRLYRLRTVCTTKPNHWIIKF